MRPVQEAIVIALCTLVGACWLCRGGDPVTRQALTPDDLAVYAAVLEQVFAQHRVHEGCECSLQMTEDQRFLVASDVGSGLRSDAKRLGASDIARFAGVPPWADEAVRDFVVQDRCRVPLPRLLPVSHGYDLLTEQEHDAIFSDNREGWKRLWARWPHVNGIVSLSRIGFTADRDCAFLALGGGSGRS